MIFLLRNLNYNKGKQKILLCCCIVVIICLVAIAHTFTDLGVGVHHCFFSAHEMMLIDLVYTVLVFA